NVDSEPDSERYAPTAMSSVFDLQPSQASPTRARLASAVTKRRRGRRFMWGGLPPDPRGERRGKGVPPPRRAALPSPPLLVAVFRRISRRSASAQARSLARRRKIPQEDAR